MAMLQPLRTTLYLLVVDLLHIANLLVLNPLSWLKRRFVTDYKAKLSLAFKGKMVVITGASSGIGLEMSKQMAALGANIILCARNAQSLGEAERLCRVINPSGFYVAHIMDVSEKHSFHEFESLLRGHGQPAHVDILVLNAGVASRGSVLETEPKTFERVMAVNFFGCVYLTKTFLPGMVNRGSGHIIAVSSVQGKFGIPLRSAYAASKCALQGFFESLRGEVHGRGVKVLTVSPGYVSTALSMNAINGDGSTYGKTDDTTANGMSPARLAEVVLRAAADGAPDVTVADAKAFAGVALRAALPGLFFNMTKLKK